MTSSFTYCIYSNRLEYHFNNIYQKLNSYYTNVTFQLLLASTNTTFKVFFLCTNISLKAFADVAINPYIFHIRHRLMHRP